MKSAGVGLLLLTIACTPSESSHAPVQWSATDVQAAIRTISVSTAQLATTPVFVPDHSRERAAGPARINAGPQVDAVNAARLLSNSGTVVQMHDWKTIAFFDSLGRESAPRITSERYEAEKLCVGPGDTVYMSVGEMRAGRDHVVRIFNGFIVDSLASSLRNLSGVRSDGSLVYWNVMPYRSPKGMAEYRTYVHPEAFVTIVSKQPADWAIVADIQIVIEQRLGRALPWSRKSQVDVGGGTAWISPAGGPELLRVGLHGRPDLHVQWEVSDSAVSSAELEEIKRRLRNGVPQRWDANRRKEMLDTIEQLIPESNAKAIDRLIGGRDGSIWVRKRIPEFSAVPLPHNDWIGFRSNGELIGTLRLAPDVYVYDLTESEALLEWENAPSAVMHVPLVRATVRF